MSRSCCLFEQRFIMKGYIILATFFYLISYVTCAQSAGNDKFQELRSLSKTSGPIDLDESIYKKLTSAPRNYHTAILLTASEARFGCQLCREFQPEWDLLARSWNKGATKDTAKLLFGTLEFMKGRDVFMKVDIIASSCKLWTLIDNSCEAHATNRSGLDFLSPNHWSERQSRCVTHTI